MSPLTTETGAAFLVELVVGLPKSDLEGILDAHAGSDADFAIEQYVLAAVVAEAVDPGAEPRAASAAGALRDPEELTPLAKACVNRLLNDPYCPLWAGHGDGGITARRQARALRARLHRACTS